jgi:hypothetical protein
VGVTLAEITDRNREAAFALHVAPGQERFVGSVRSALAKAARYPHAKPAAAPACLSWGACMPAAVTGRLVYG